MTDFERLQEALRAIDCALGWYRSAGGAVSRHDMEAMIENALGHLNGVRAIIYPDYGLGEQADLAELSNEF